MTAPLRAARRMFEVLYVLVLRDQKARYHSTLMGVAWIAASPLMFMATFYFLFSVIMPMNIEHYASFLFIGIIAWTWLQSSVGEGVWVVVANAGLINQPRVPSLVLPLATVVTHLVNFVTTLPILAVILWIEVEPPHLVWLWILPVVCGQFLLVLAATYFAAAVNVVFRDMAYIVPILLQLGYFATPIFYDIGGLSARAQAILKLNPMTTIMQAYRDVLIHGLVPDLPALGIVLAVAAVLLGLALAYYRRCSHLFLEEI